MRSVSEEVGELGKEVGYQWFRTNSDSSSTWIIVDFIDVVIHLFEPGRRAYYDLEDLWSDAARMCFTQRS